LHQYLRAIGFKSLDSKKKLQKIVTDVINSSGKTDYTSYPGEEDCILMECSKEYGNDFGITVRGQFDESNHYIFDYYYPFLKGRNISTAEDITVERHSARESYAGVCDDYRLGVTLIFYLQNIIPYLKLKEKMPQNDTSLNLAALSKEGKIMMPLQKSEKQKGEAKKLIKTRKELIDQARMGDEEAMEHLTIEDMDTYTAISQKIVTEDILSIVDTYFMPYGVECDQYSILGEILNVEELENSFSHEKIYRMAVCCNELIFDLCVNKDDVLGVPEPGRRYKGTIWMQGYINFPNE